MQFSIYDSIQTKNNYFNNFVENYTYLEGISGRFGHKKYRVTNTNGHLEHQQIMINHNWKSVIRTICKIASYILCPILPLIAFIYKSLSRRVTLAEPKRTPSTGTQNVIKPIPPPIQIQSQNNTGGVVEKPGQQNSDQKAPAILPLDISKLKKVYNKEVVSEYLNNYSLKGFELRNRAWLSNYQLDSYSEHLEFSHSLFHGGHTAQDILKFSLQNLKEWEDANNPERELFDVPLTIDKRYISFNMFVAGNHWTLLLIDKVKRTVEYYDSKLNYGNHETVKESIRNFTQELSKAFPGKKDFEFQCKITEVLQPDSHQCGPWVEYFLENRIINPDVDFNKMDLVKAQDMIAEYRNHIQMTLLHYHDQMVKDPSSGLPLKSIVHLEGCPVKVVE